MKKWYLMNTRMAPKSSSGRVLRDDTRKVTGEIGERWAEKLMVSKGYSVVERNFRTPFGEIDLIAERDGCIVFLEVRTKTSRSFGSPLSSITREKKKRMIRNCKYFLKLRGLLWGPCRIDVMGIQLDDSLRLERIQHIKNAVEDE